MRPRTGNYFKVRKTPGAGRHKGQLNLKPTVKHIFVVLAAGLLLASCGHFSLSSFFRGDPLARVGKAELYLDDIRTIFTPGLTPEDSVELLHSYVDAWIKQQLKLQLAEEQLSAKQRDIDSLVTDYRNALMIFKFEQQYLDRHTDTLLTDAQLREYYDENRDEFATAGPMMKAVVVQVPDGFRQENQMREMARSGNAEKLQDLFDICVKNNIPYTEFTEWTDMSYIYASVPRGQQGSDNGLAADRSFYELMRGDTRYFIIITDRLAAGTPMPFSMTREVIRTTLLNRRKQDALRRLEDSVYNAAQAQKEIVTYFKDPDTQ